MDVWIGTSGYVYREWVGAFYPRGTSSASMLTHYAHRFPLVELNFSYYQVPRAQQFVRMLARVPADFRFIVKAHRSLTHEFDGDAIRAFASSLQPLREAVRLVSVLCQFPQRFHRCEENRDWINRLKAILDRTPLSIEFRHESWDRPHVYRWLREEELTLVSVDVPSIPSLFPRKLVQTSRDLYVRLHSRREANWYASGADRYDYDYSDGELQEWVNALQRNEGGAERAYVLFNNCRDAHAALNARRMAELMRLADPNFHLIEPIPTPSEQGTLFEL